MSDILGIIDIIDRTSTIVSPVGVDNKDLCMLVILLARYHSLAHMGDGMTYEIYKGQFMKKPAYVLRDNNSKEIFFRVDEKSKDVFWKGGKNARANLKTFDYAFDDGILYNINESTITPEKLKEQREIWEKHGLIVSPDMNPSGDATEIIVSSGYVLGKLELSDEPEDGCVFEAQGPRPSMEDTHTVAKMGDGIIMYGVFDGHGGPRVSEILKKDLPQRIHAELEKIDVNNTDAVKETLTKTFLDTDYNLFNSFQGPDGSTAIVALLVGKTLYFANLGDSRGLAVQYESGDIVLDTKDHKPSDEKESARALMADRPVIWGRVGGILAVSRAFGDRGLKTDTDDNYLGKDAAVSSEPDIYVTTLEDEKTYNILLACDGLWDVMSNKDVANHIVDEGSTSNNICQELVEMALRNGSRDNVTVMSIDILH